MFYCCIAAGDFSCLFQLEDTGKLLQEGFSAGARSAPQFDWVKNILSKKVSPGTISEHKFDTCSVFALFWNKAKRYMPPEIYVDFEQWFVELGVTRMHAAGPSQSPQGSYTLSIAGEPITFENVEMAPPAGVFGWNYSR